jgi:putative radical SAM enzyme (TIGR03279 family)
MEKNRIESGSRAFEPALNRDDLVSPIIEGTESDCVQTTLQRTKVSRDPGLKILSVAPGSPLFSYIRPEDFLLSVNGSQVSDTIDFHYKMADDELDILFKTAGGEELLFEFDAIPVAELGLTFEQGPIRTCNNGCIFCFVMQQPKGMRRSLYIMDEDYRYSFTHGNFVTLSNTSDRDIDRIIEQRLSPLYVSVHATDDTLRRCMLKNEKLHPIVPRIKRLTDGGITVHTQVVVCPGINDGPELERTIRELVELYPGVESLALAPVGLTKYRDNLSDIAIYGAESAAELIDRVEVIQDECFKKLGTRFVWPADEFYTNARRSFPKLSAYEELSQFENGIGMCRSLITSFNRKKRYLKELVQSSAPKGRIIGLTGSSAYYWLESEVAVPAQEMGIDLHFHETANIFWGGTVTVSGLLTGADLLSAGKRVAGADDVLLLPPNCLNNDDLFLDDMTFKEFCDQAPCRVVVGSYDMVETLKEVFDPGAFDHSAGMRSRSVALTEAV